MKNIFFFKGLQFFDIQRTQYTFTSATTVGPEVEQAVATRGEILHGVKRLPLTAALPVQLTPTLVILRYRVRHASPVFLSERRQSHLGYIIECTSAYGQLAAILWVLRSPNSMDGRTYIPVPRRSELPV